MIAILLGFDEYCRILLTHGADPNIQGRKNMSEAFDNLLSPLQVSILQMQAHYDKGIQCFKQLIKCRNLDLNLRSTLKGKFEYLLK